MKRRRVNWERRVLVWTLMGCLAVNILLVVIGGLTNNERRIREELAREMENHEGPVIELTGGETMTMAVGDALVEPGVVAYDYRAIPQVEIESLVDVLHAGEYEITYRASDGNGNVTEAKRKVRVIEPAGRIYLTFDDGPSEYTGALLDILAKYNVKATFFVTGYGDDALIKREYDEGHAVGIHTNSHVYAELYRSVDSFATDFNAVGERIKNITGKSTRLMRFPGGSSNVISANYDGGARIMSTLVGLVTEWGYSYYDWNVDSDDAGGANSAEEVYTNVVTALKWGGDSVILQHDLKPYSVEAVERIIQYGLDNNFVFAKLTPTSFSAHHSVNN